MHDYFRVPPPLAHGRRNVAGGRRGRFRNRAGWRQGGIPRLLAAALLGVAVLSGFARSAAAQDPVIVPESWVFTPSAFTNGDQFRLLFVTSTKRDASSSNIADYDTFVQNRVAAGHNAIRPYSSQFKVVGSTETVDARDHTGTTHTTMNPGVPIYWLKTNIGNGARVAADYANFYDGGWDNNSNARKESGQKFGNTALFTLKIWTGTHHDGTKSASPLGGSSLTSSTTYGELNSITRGPLNHGQAPKTTQYELYGLSPVFEVGVVPVDVSLSVSASGAVTEGGSVTITATASQQNDTGAAVSIPIQTRAAETTAQAADYTVASAISIPNGATTGTTAFSATLGDGDELGEEVVIELGTLPTGWQGKDMADSVLISITDNDPTPVTLSVTDGTADEGDMTDTGTIRLTLGRALIANEVLDVPLQFAGGDVGTNFSLALSGSPTGVTFSSSTVTFTGPSAATADVTLTALDDNLGVDETVTVSIPATDSGTPSLSATGLDGGASGSGTGQVIIDDDDPTTYIVSLTSTAADSLEGSAGHEDRGVIELSVAPDPPDRSRFNIDICLTGDATYGFRTGIAWDYHIVDRYGDRIAFHSGCTTDGIHATTELDPFSIRVRSDTDIEDDETLTLTLHRVTDSRGRQTRELTPQNLIISPTNSSVTYTILTDDFPSLDLSVSDAGEVTEGGTLTVTATLGEARSGSGLDIPLQRAGAHSTASASDYTLSGSPAGTISVADGATSGSVTLTAVDNTNDMPSKTLRLALASPPSDYVVGTDHVDIRIMDNEASWVNLVLPDTTATEGDPSATARIELVLNRRLYAPEVLVVPLLFGGGALGVDFNLSKGSATESEIELNEMTGELTFSGAGNDAVVLLTAADDADAMDSRVTVSIPTASSGPAPILTATDMDGGVQGHNLGTGWIAITDDDEPAATFALTSATEGEANATVDATVSLSPAPPADITLRYAIAGSATRGADYGIAGVTSSTGTLSVSAGATAATISIGVLDDIAWESSETVVLTLKDGADYEVGSDSVYTLTITDNDTAEASFASSASNSGEAAGAFDVTINLDPAPPAGITLNYMLSGTATRHLDYSIAGVTSNTGTLSVSAGATAATLSIGIVEDNVTEAGETVILTLQPGVGYTLGSMHQHTVTITDNDAAALVLSKGSLTVHEGGEDGGYSIRLATNPDGPVTVTPQSDNAAAATVSGPLAFNFVNWQTPQTVTVTPVDDDDADDEIATITHTVSGYGNLTQGPTVTVGVNDDEISPDAGVQTSVLTLQLTEGGAAGSYEVTLNTDPEATVTITPQSGDTGALTVSGALTFNSSNWGDPQTVTATPRNDTDTDNETVTIAHLVAGYPGVPSAGPNVTATIADDDEPPPAASFAASSASASEGTGIVNVRINLDRAAPTDLTLSYSVGGTASSGADFSIANAGSATVSSGSAGATATISIAEDGVTEGSETVVLTLQGGPGYTVGNPPAYSLVIADNDAGSISTNLPSLSLALQEGGEAGSYTLALDNQPDGAVTVTPSSSDAQAVAVSGALTFDSANWEEPQTVTVTPVDDADMDDESVTITHAVAGYGDLTQGPEVQASVADNEAPGVMASTLTLSIREGGEAASYTLALRTDPGGPVTVTPSSSNEQAATVSGALAFDNANWQTPQTVTVTPVNDANVEDDRVTITHTVAGYPNVAAGPVVHVTVVDATTIISVEEEERKEEEIPTAFALEQNYPNPFNPATTIAFALDETQRVTLTVYDLLGQKVRTLVDGVRPAARYRVPFDASDLASGTYIYVLRTEAQTAAKTMVLLK